MSLVVLPGRRAQGVIVRIQALVVMAFLAPSALAHETLHEVRHGKAVALRAYQSDGEPLAGAAFEVYSPAEPKRPWASGLTDGDGWLAFVPSAPGRWRVRVIEAAGHGLDVEVEAQPAPLERAATPSGAAFFLRPLLGLGVIGLIFAALFLAWRKKGRSSSPGAGR